MAVDSVVDVVVYPKTYESIPYEHCVRIEEGVLFCRGPTHVSAHSLCRAFRLQPEDGDVDHYLHVTREVPGFLVARDVTYLTRVATVTERLDRAIRDAWCRRLTRQRDALLARVRVIERAMPTQDAED